MNSLHMVVLWTAVGMLAGWWLRAIYSGAALHRADVREAKALELAEERHRRLSLAESELSSCKQVLEQSVAEKYSLRSAIDTSRARLQQQQVAGRQQLELLDKRNQELKGQIEAISARVFADNSHRMAEQTEIHLQHLLTPLREQIGEFKQRVEEVYDLSLIHISEPTRPY